MARRKTLQTNFSAGELAPDLGMRQDTDQYQNGAKSLRNRRCLIGGGTKRRPGSWNKADLPGPCRLFEWVVNQSTAYFVAIGDGFFFAYTTDGVAAGSISGCPWTGDIWRELDFVQSGNTMFLVHTDMVQQVVTRTGAATWSRQAFSYYSGPAGRPEQPYLKLAAPSVTLQPSALTGSITLTASSAVLQSGHVGSYIRYVKKACLVTAVASDGLSCTATVIETLPDTQTLTVTSTAKFAVGESVTGATSNAEGFVTAVTDATHLNIIQTNGLIPFTTENLVGPNGVTAISAVSSAGTKGATTDWDEQMFGPVYGYPSCVELHRNRLLFGGHLTAPDYLAGSALNNLYDFNVGTGADGDGILESVGDGQASRIVQLHSAEQLLVATDHGLYYCPESASAPFRPSSIAFFPFGSPWPINATCKHRPFDNGVLVVSGSTIIKARPTGDLTRSWDADEVSLLAHHIVSNPSALAVTSNFANGPERYAIAVNDDGTLVALQLVESQKIRNMTPWDTNGTYTAIAAVNDTVAVAVTRSIAGNTRYVLEIFDQDLTLDCVTEYASSLATVTDTYGATTVRVVTADYDLGNFPLSIETPPPGPYFVGLNYTAVLETLPPVIEGPNGSHASDFKRILESFVHVIGSARFAVNGRALNAYQLTDDLDEPPPDLNGPQRFQFAGWSREPTISITQPDALPLDILAVRQEVAY